MLVREPQARSPDEERLRVLQREMRRVTSQTHLARRLNRLDRNNPCGINGNALAPEGLSRRWCTDVRWARRVQRSSQILFRAATRG